MTDAPHPLDYATPAERGLWPIVRAAATIVLTLAVVWIAVWFLPTALAMARNHNSSFGGCRTGRLEIVGLLITAAVPLMAGGLTRGIRSLGVRPAWRLARLCTAAVLAAYAVLWMDVLGVLHLIKFGSLFA